MPVNQVRNFAESNKLERGSKKSPLVQGLPLFTHPPSCVDNKSQNRRIKDGVVGERDVNLSEVQKASTNQDDNWTMKMNSLLKAVLGQISGKRDGGVDRETSSSLIGNSRTTGSNSSDGTQVFKKIVPTSLLLSLLVSSTC